ncbi:hypothetical protein V2W30_13460 [Streptomyces sp. Q6]|uniref:Uncharacterized protein n=1 Tax=Streptomyces citrinus TaxID=3118173 RepID=A0ACD5AAY3_9ACTN
MDHTDHLDHLISAASEQGPGNLLRVVLIVGVLGAVLLAWFLLRGYKQDDRTDD